MKFRTEIKIPSFPFKISYQDRLLFIGSCFSDVMGNFFLQNKFQTCVNPAGTLFNPISIRNILNLLVHNEAFSDKYVYNFNNQWVSFLHHGNFSHPDKAIFLENIQKNIELNARFLAETDLLFITFGTAYVYNFIERDMIVSNCHKIPNNRFEKRRLSVEEIVTAYQVLLDDLEKMNPHIKFIFTVSPVRHLGDGFHENQLSKSILHLAIDKLSERQNVFYFPAYEIVNDDLRDYRFYAEDLCHIGENAAKYMIEILKQSFFDEKTLQKQEAIAKEMKFQQHVSLH